MRGIPFQQQVAGEASTLRRYARSLTRDPSMADDLVQDTLMLALERQSSFREGGGLRGWLLSILHNRFISDRRRAQVRQRNHAEAAMESEGWYAATQEDAVRLSWLERAFGSLPQDQRRTLHLVAIEGLSYGDAGKALGVPIGTVMSRLSRARAALREAECSTGGRPQPVRLHLVGGRDDGGERSFQRR